MLLGCCSVCRPYWLVWIYALALPSDVLFVVLLAQRGIHFVAPLVTHSLLMSEFWLHQPSGKYRWQSLDDWYI